MSTTNFLSGVLAGVAAGVVVGLLCAPDSGEETRRKIRYTAGNWRYRIGRLLGKGSDNLAELRHVFEHEVTGLKEDVRERVLKLIDESKTSYDKFRKEALSQNS
ncbi:YtxH domain-containing protein [Chitinophaga japonensis]|uniref:Gas vesicle protein n=1 Tax=Chitinophaga japonensis TaxID=104662 RepID=A0A562STG0_CHIJA|nr:YtxH domain-containing protein [Chitinophaga japonensis]TWI84388.1 gas vesicle protein [Chitinophaga japonensis]